MSQRQQPLSCVSEPRSYEREEYVLKSGTVFQTLGGAIFVSAAQTAFENTLIHSLLTLARPINPASVIATGATGLRAAFGADQLPDVLTSYMRGLNVAFALAIPLAGLTCFIALFSEWRNIKNKSGGVVGGA